MEIAEIVRRIDRMPTERWNGEAWRHVALGRSALSGEGARIVGGRWNPAGSFAVLYLGTSVATVIAEFHRLLSRQRVDPSQVLPRTLYRFDVNLTKVLDLTGDASREALGFQGPELATDALATPQAIGEAAFVAGRDAILAPSATGEGIVLAIFTAHLGNESSVVEEEVEIWEQVPPRPG